MNQKRFPPPDCEECLISSVRCKPKGGTRIAEDVTTLEEHVRRVAQPDGYRPARCVACGHSVVHVHDYRYRLVMRLSSDHAHEVIRIVRHVCAFAACGAIVQTLPAFVARFLRHAWKVVEATTMTDTPVADRRRVPPRTRSRWSARLLSTALVVVQLFAMQTGSWLERLAQQLGFDVTREAPVIAFATRAGVRPGERLGAVATALARLHRGARLA